MGGVCPNASANGQNIPRPPSGFPEVTVAVRIALLPCREPGKPRISKPVPGSSGESRVRGREFMHRNFIVLTLVPVVLVAPLKSYAQSDQVIILACTSTVY